MRTGDNLVQDRQIGDYGTITVNGKTTLIDAEDGWEIVPEGKVIRRGWRVFDYYAGWMMPDNYHADNGHHTRREGRWLAWEKRKRK